MGAWNLWMHSENVCKNILNRLELGFSFRPLYGILHLHLALQGLNSASKRPDERLSV